MGIGDSGHDLRQDRILARGRSADHQGACAVHSAADHPLARSARDGQGLARDHGFVYIRTAFDDLAICRHTSTGAQFDLVASDQITDSDHLHHTVAPHPCLAHLQPCQFADRLPCLPAGPRLKPAAQQDQGHNDGCGLKINLGCAGRQYAGCEGRHGRKTPCRRGAQRHQRVHIRCAVQKRRYTQFEKPQSRSEQDKRGQGKLDHPACAHANRAMQPVMEWWPDMPAHGQHHDRQGQYRRDQRVAAQSGNFGRVARGGSVGSFIGQCARAIACPLHCSDQRSLVHRSGQDTQPRLPVGKVETGRHDTRQSHQGSLNPRHARTAGRAIDTQPDILLSGRVTCLGQCRSRPRRGYRPVMCDLGPACGKIHPRLAHAVHTSKRRFGTAHAACTAQPRHIQSQRLFHRPVLIFHIRQIDAFVGRNSRELADRWLRRRIT